MHRYCLPLLAVACLLHLAPHATAGVVTKDGKWLVSGQFDLKLTSYSGTSTGVNIDLGTGPEPSGPLSWQLDSTLDNRVYFDFDTATVTLDVNLLITFPLQQALSTPPVPIRLLERGDLPAFDLLFNQPAVQGSFDETHDGLIGQPLLPDQQTLGSGEALLELPSAPLLAFRFDPTFLTGGGLVETGPFAGMTYTNGQTLEAKGNIMGQTFSVKYTSTPVPSSLTLTLIGLPLGLVFLRRKLALAS